MILGNIMNPFYERLKNIDNFRRVKVSGINIEWVTGEDIAPENLYYDSKLVSEYNEEIEELD